MAKVLCKLPNASANINGVRFVSHRDGMISEEVDDAVALAFADIQGYEIHDPGKTDEVAAAVLEAARKGGISPPPPTRVGPTDPHPDMVICPTCTSQFAAIPVNVQTRLQALEKAAATTSPITPAAAPKKAAAAPKSTPPVVPGANASSETSPADKPEPTF